MKGSTELWKTVIKCYLSLLTTKQDIKPLLHYSLVEIPPALSLSTLLKVSQPSHQHIDATKFKVLATYCHFSTLNETFSKNVVI